MTGKMSAVSVAAAVLFATAALLHSSEAHSMGLGGCENVEHQQNFLPDQFVGLWYVIEIFSTTSKCMTMTFNKTDTGFKVTEGRELYAANKFNIDHTFRNTGTFTFKNPSDPADMTVKWPSSIFRFIKDPDVMVVDTDYTTFAVLYECLELFLAKRESAVILSRTPELDNATIQKIKDDMAAFGVDVKDFDIIDHRDCNTVGDADFNWAIDENTFGQAEDASSASVVHPEDAEIMSADPSFNEVF